MRIFHNNDFSEINLTKPAITPFHTRPPLSPNAVVFRDHLVDLGYGSLTLLDHGDKAKHTLLGVMGVCHPRFAAEAKTYVRVQGLSTRTTTQVVLDKSWPHKWTNKGKLAMY